MRWVVFMKSNFGRELKAWRDSDGLSQDEAGALIGVSGTAIQNWESGDHFPSNKRWRRIKEKTGIDPVRYMDYSSTATATTATNSPMAAVSADNCFSVEVRQGQQQADKHTVTLTPQEHELFLLWRRYGNEVIFERCLDELRRAEKYFNR